MDLRRIVKSYRTKITLSILGVGLVVMLLILLVTYTVGRTHLQNTIGSNYRELAVETSQKLKFLIEHNVRSARFLALTSDVRAGVELANAAYSQRRMSETDVRKRIEILTQLWEKSQGADDLVEGFLKNPASDFIRGALRQPKERRDHLAITATDRRGILVAADAKPARVYYGDDPWWLAAFNRGQGSIYISDIQVMQPATEEFDRQFSLTIAVPIMDAGGTQAIGVLRSDLQVQPFFEAVTRVHLGKSDHTMLASSDGTLIFCPIFLIRNHTLLPELMQTIFKDQPGWAITLADVHYTGQKTISAFSPVDFGDMAPSIHPASFGGKQWYIFTSQDPLKTYAPIQTLLDWILISLGAGVVLLSGLGLRAAGYVVRPLQALQRGAKLIGFGNLDHRITIRTGDEIQDVADEFNEMTIKLKASYSSLERKVSERTQELSVINKITRTISSSLNIHQIFDALAAEVKTVIPFDQIRLALTEEKKQEMTVQLVKTRESPTKKQEEPVPLKGTVVEWVTDHSRPFYRRDITEGSRFAEDGELQREDLRSYLAMPILSHRRVIGSLLLAGTQPHAFSDRNMEILVPITEQLAIAVETIRLFEQTKKLDQLKSEFVSKVSHELRTPLTSIKGFTEILLSYRDVDLKTQQEFISIIHEESERLTRLINDILDLSKIEAGRIEWKIRPLSINEIVTHTVKSIRAIAIEKNLPIVLEVPEGLPEIRGDRDRLIQVMDNLLSNAIKFTEKGKITIESRREDGWIRTSVIDTGIGIPTVDQQKIFEKFAQLVDPRGGKPKGTGLGLAICHEIVLYLGGRIWCESKRGKGSTFHFTLPVWSPAGRGDTGGLVPSATAPPETDRTSDRSQDPVQ